MGYRLSRIYTRTGDAGQTGLGDGSRVAKTSPRVEAMGAVDELNSHVGLLLSQGLAPEAAALLVQVQHDLFDVGGELAIPGTVLVHPASVGALEQAIDTLNATLPPLEEFVLPGGTPSAAQCHVARSVCRRAEREVLRLAEIEAVNPTTVMYLNRLSDVLFVLARSLARAGGGREVTWARDRRHGG